jgi:hypothetical protein
MAIERDRDTYREVESRGSGGLIAGLLVVLALIIGGYLWYARDHSSGTSTTSSPGATTTIPKDTSQPVPKSGNTTPPSPTTK